MPGETESRSERRPPVQYVVFGTGLVLLLVGLLGFVPGATTDYHMLRLAGRGPSALLFDTFSVTIVRNLLFVVLGVVFLAVTRTPPLAHGLLIAAGLVYLLLYGYGLLAGRGADANLLGLNDPDNWMHLAIAMVLLASAFLAGQKRHPTHSTSPPGDV
ncbi:DUF4383 domain-containing protein [Sciscionella marina]|uniref:DUF4383 domain-containing protein n=1 Tax=Sciscionella marina TaxID=508770 RepID=UPI0003744D34|nr:DUF4383 domain-containing protein [Sciscionella marina]